MSPCARPPPPPPSPPLAVTLPRTAGPMPINNWLTHFARTIANPTGNVHIAIINSEAIYDSQTDSDEMVPGTHWFLAAWRVNPDQ